MQPLEGLTVHAVPHPNPKVQRVGIELNDPYVEQMYAGVVGSTRVMLLRRLQLLWRDREPARVDLASWACRWVWAHRPPSDYTWWTAQRLVRFGTAHWLLGDALGLRTRLAPPHERQLRRLPEWTPPGA